MGVARGGKKEVAWGCRENEVTPMSPCRFSACAILIFHIIVMNFNLIHFGSPSWLDIIGINTINKKEFR